MDTGIDSTNRSRNFVYVFLLVVFAVGVYLNSFGNDFVWDCDTLILNWQEIRSLKNIPAFLKGNVPFEHRGVYRPIRNVFYALNYRLWGKDPFGYHFNSLLIHLLSTILVYFLILAIGKTGLKSGTPNSQYYSLPTPKRQMLAFMGALLFAVHPIHTESITYVTASFDVIGVVFFLISFYLYVIAFSRENPRSDRKAISAYVFSLIFAALAFFTYELTLTLTLVLLTYDVCFRKVRYKTYLPYIFITLIYVLIRVFLIGVRGRGSYIEGSFYLTMLTMSKAFLKYISLSILPVGLNVNHVVSRGIFSLLYAENCTEAVRAQSILETRVLAAVAVVVLLVSTAFMVKRKLPVVSFCIFWFFITLIPVSNIVPFQSIMSEKYLYLPSVGICFLMAYLIFKLINMWGRVGRTAGLLVFVSITLFYAGGTCARNKDWRNKITLWQATLRQVPDSAMAHMNLGAAYIHSGNIDKAIYHLQKAIELRPNNAKAYNNLGIVYYQQNNPREAVKCYLKVLELTPYYYKTYNNLGVVYGALGEHEKEIECYRNALKLKPSFIMARYNLGVVYFAKGLYELAGNEWEKILEIDTENIPAREALTALKDK